MAETPERSPVSQLAGEEEDRTAAETPSGARSSLEVSKSQSDAPGDMNRTSLDCLKNVLRAYQQASQQVEPLPFLVPLRRSENPLGALTVPAWRPLVRYFVVGHIAKNLRALRRAYSIRAAIAEDTQAEAAERQRLDYALEGFPPVPSRRVLLSFVSAAALISLVLSGTYLAAFAIVSLVFSAPIEISRLTTSLRDVWLSLLPVPDLGKLATAVAGLDGNPSPSLGDLAHLYAGAILTGLSAYVPLTLAVGSFHLKRLLFATYPAMHEAPRTPIISGLYAKGGIYELEAQRFAAVGGQRPRDVPLDLIRRSVFPAAVILWSLPLAIPSSLWLEVINGVEDSVWRTPLASMLGWSQADFLMAVRFALGLWAIWLFSLFILLPVTRLVWLLWVHRVRSAQGPSTVRQAPSTAAMRGDRSATRALYLGIAALVLALFLGLGLLLGLLAVWSAKVALRSIEVGDRPGTRFRASAGRFLGWCGIAFSALVLFFPLVIFALRG